MEFSLGCGKDIYIQNPKVIFNFFLMHSNAFCYLDLHKDGTRTILQSCLRHGWSNLQDGMSTQEASLSSRSRSAGRRLSWSLPMLVAI